MKIIHFSDAHAGGPAEDWMAYIDKRWVGVFNYRFRRKFQHDLKRLELAVNFILEDKPDVAVFTGDLTSAGQPGEFAKTLEILKPLRDSDIPLLAIPGNHDYYVKRPVCVDAMKQAISYLSNDRLTFDNMPTKLTFNGTDFLIVNESWPSNLLCSWGFLKKDSTEFLINECAQPKDRVRILIGHYPLIEDYPLLRMRHRLWGQKQAVELLRAKKLDLSLCGHVHFPYSKLDETGRGETCAGSITRNGCLSIIEYLPEIDRFSHECKYIDRITS